MKIVILAAGFGSRLWPLSTPSKPKQFQKVLLEESLLQYTYRLFSNVSDSTELYVLSLAGFEPTIQDQLPGISSDHIIAVPGRRNILPHTLFALQQITASPDEQVLFIAVDNYLENPTEALPSIKNALITAQAKTNEISILCTQYDSYDPNASYVRVSEDQRITAYMEKPTEQELQELLTSGIVMKETVMFVASVSAIKQAATSVEPSLQQHIDELFAASNQKQRDAIFLRFAFMATTYLFEKAKNLSMIEVRSPFTDVGRYSSLYQLLPKDKQQNAVIGNVVLGEGCEGNLIINRTTTPLVVIDQHDMVIVHTSEGYVHAPFTSIDSVGEIYKAKLYHQMRAPVVP